MGLRYRLVADERYYRQIQVVSGDEKLAVHLDERIRQVRRRLTDEDRSKKGPFFSRNQEWTQEKVPTGELILKIAASDRYGVSKEWREGSEARPLEEQLDDVLAQVAGLFEELRLRRERELEEQKRQWEREQERQRRQMERKRETIRVRRLVSHCEDWRRAHDIRAFVAAVEGSAVAKQQSDAFTAWKAWALAQADLITRRRRMGCSTTRSAISRSIRFEIDRRLNRTANGRLGSPSREPVLDALPLIDSASPAGRFGRGIAMLLTQGSHPMHLPRLLVSKKELKSLGVPYSFQHIARLEKAGLFPKRIQLGPCRVAWSFPEVKNWIDERIARRDHSAS